MILLIDNYDSFTYNLKQSLEQSGEKVLVFRNDAVSVNEIKRKIKPRAIVISPGPGNPDSAGVSLEVIGECSGHIPIFGVCLGHQAIGQAFGGQVVRAPRPMHGKISQISHDQQGIFKNLESPTQVTRYHSLVVDQTSLPSCLEITAQTQDGLIMGLRHKTLQVEGVQFHPESIATEQGIVMIRNFIAGLKMRPSTPSKKSTTKKSAPQRRAK